MAKNHPKQDRDGDSEPQAELQSDGLIRLNKFMAELGVASRRKCDELISGGKVTVDGQPAVELGMKIDPSKAVVDVNGVVLKPLSVRKRYYLLNKPRHVLCTNEARETRARAIDLITDRNKGRIFTVGRLDEDSSGLLLLTNDGDFTNQIAHPRHSVPKTYLVKVRGRIDDEALARISEGVRLSEGKTSGAALHVERRANEATVLTVTIREGMNREIRRVFAALGYKVLRLHRVRIGALSDRRLKDGEWRPLTPEEVADLLDIANNKARAEELFARASHGSYAKKSAEFDADADDDRSERPERGGTRRPADEAQRSRFGGVRRDWHEPKEFRIKSGTRKPRFDPNNPPAKEREGTERESAGDLRAPRPAFKPRPGRSSESRRPAGDDRGARPGFEERSGRSSPSRGPTGGDRGDRPAFGKRPGRTSESRGPAGGDRGERPAFGKRPGRSSDSRGPETADRGARPKFKKRPGAAADRRAPAGPNRTARKPFNKGPARSPEGGGRSAGRARNGASGGGARPERRGGGRR